MKYWAKKVFFGTLTFVGFLILFSVLRVADDIIADVSAEVLHAGYKDMAPDNFLSGATLVDIRDSLKNDFHADVQSLINQYKYLGFFTSETDTYITMSDSAPKERVINENCSHGSQLSICAIVGYSIKPPSQTLVFRKGREVNQYTIMMLDGNQTIELNPYRYTTMHKTDDRFLIEVFSK